MPKIITSPSAYFAGSVTISDPLSFPQFIAWEDALAAVKETSAATVGDVASNARASLAVLPGVLACVDRWELQHLPNDPTPDTFPATPRAEVFKLVAC